MVKYRLIGAASGLGAQIHACALGPQILKEEGLVENLQACGFSVSALDLLHPKKENPPKEELLKVIQAFNLELAKHVEQALLAHEFPIVLGGDHSIAVGTWNGAHQFFKREKKLPMGLIWIDAHMDSHTFETTPSGAPHGMPLAGLLGYGDPTLAKLKSQDPVLFPEHICLIGPRSFEEGEAKLLEKLNVKIYFAEEVQKRGIEEVLKEAVLWVSKHTKAFGVSLDLDVICPEEAPGVGSPEKGGIHAEPLMKALAQLKQHPHFNVFELVEYNPKRNHHHQTAKICFEILSKVLKK